jgi:hypothetical protein
MKNTQKHQRGLDRLLCCEAISDANVYDDQNRLHPSLVPRARVRQHVLALEFFNAQRIRGQAPESRTELRLTRKLAASPSSG